MEYYELTTFEDIYEARDQGLSLYYYIDGEYIEITDPEEVEYLMYEVEIYTL